MSRDRVEPHATLEDPPFPSAAFAVPHGRVRGHFAWAHANGLVTATPLRNSGRLDDEQ